MVDLSGFDERDQRWYCACNTHCEKGVFAIGAFSIILGLFSFIGYTTYVLVLSGIINIVLGAILVVASKRRDVSLLWPSIVTLYVQIGLAVFGIVCSFIASIVFFAKSRDDEGGEALAALFVLCLNLPLGIWFLSVVKQYRSFLEAYSRVHGDNNRSGFANAPQTFVTPATVTSPPTSNVVYPSQPVVNPNFEPYKASPQSHVNPIQ